MNTIPMTPGRYGTETSVTVEYGIEEQVHIVDKVITTMVIRPLDEHTYCDRSAFTQSGLWQKL